MGGSKASERENIYNRNAINELKRVRVRGGEEDQVALDL